MRANALICMLPLAGVLGATLAWCLMPPALLAYLLEEGHALETLTVWAWGLAGLLLAVVAFARADRRTAPLALVVVFLLFAARELDLHKSLTGTSVLRLSWYFKGSFSGTKALALIVLAVFVVALIYLLLRHGRTLWQRMRQGEPAAVAAFVFLATLVASKVLDRAVDVLANGLGIQLPSSGIVLAQSGEELLELMLPLIAILAALQHLRSQSETPGARAGRLMATS